MADKKLGADLIFDLDGDHLPGVTDKDFPGMIDVIQEQAWSLWTISWNLILGSRRLSSSYISGHRGFICIIVTQSSSILIQKHVGNWSVTLEAKGWKLAICEHRNPRNWLGKTSVKGYQISCF